MENQTKRALFWAVLPAVAGVALLVWNMVGDRPVPEWVIASIGFGLIGFSVYLTYQAGRRSRRLGSPRR
jgi:hypothetical protein